MVRPKFGNFVDCDLKFVKDDNHVCPQLSIATILNRTALTKAKGIRVQYFAIFEKLVFAITSRTLTIQVERIEIKSSLHSKLQTLSICLIRIPTILEVFAKTIF